MTIRDDRRALHQIPELHKSLPETFAYLHQALSFLNCRVFSPVEGSLCAFFDFGKADAIAFRADADALPSRRKPVRLTLPGMRAVCTPAATTGTWRSFWNWPAA